MPVSALPPKDLYHACDPKSLGFGSSDELSPLEGLLGQDRALEAVRFGIRMEHLGYNMYVEGDEESGHGDDIADLMRDLARSESVPPDWVYVSDFENGRAPIALSLTPGKGKALRDHVSDAISKLRTALPAIFENEQYRARRSAIEEAFEGRYADALATLQRAAEAEGIALFSSPRGLSALPLDENGETLSPEQIETLSPEVQEQINGKIEALWETIEDITRTEIPKWEAERIDALHELNKEFAESVVSHAVADIRGAIEGEAAALDWLDHFAEDIVRNIAMFAPQADESEAEEDPNHMLFAALMGPEEGLDRYLVNLVVDNSQQEGAPVIVPDHVTLSRLTGAIDYNEASGVKAIRPGFLHKANGGYIVIDFFKIYMDDIAWEALKHALLSNKLEIENPGSYDSFLEDEGHGGPLPQAIPLDVKVILYGPSWSYARVRYIDDEFRKLFKVQVAFSDVTDRTAETELLLSRKLAGVVRSYGLKPFDPSAMARIIEYASRAAGDAQRLSLLMEPFHDIVREADYQAREEGAARVTGAHVAGAIAARKERGNDIQDYVEARFGDEIIMVDTQGARVGQINALVVLSPARSESFGSASRVTARVVPGNGTVTNIERSVGMAGKIYSKGVEILTAWITAQFGSETPVPFKATIAHEQSYGGIDGDSASSTEIYALLSALSDVPIKQNFAVTGSVDQFGEVQAIGGVNEKIEGFYDLCASRGLTGDQGVLIPVSNVRHLMLREDIVEAARKGRFSIYPIRSIDEGIELLTGVPAGEKGKDGSYPEDSIYGRVTRRLAQMKPANGAGKNGGSGDEKSGGEAAKPKSKRWFFSRS